MFLKRLVHGGFAALSEWRDLWNGEVLDYLRGLQIVPGSGIRVRRLPSGTVIEAEPVASVGSAPPPLSAGEYNSYFKLALTAATENGATTYSVTIADGATAGNSTAVVNGYTTYSIAPYTEVVTASRLFYLKYTPATYTSSGAVSVAATLIIESSDNLVLPAYGTNGSFYTQIGRVVFADGQPAVFQDFTAGVADIRWYAVCGR